MKILEQLEKQKRELEKKMAQGKNVSRLNKMRKLPSSSVSTRKTNIRILRPNVLNWK